jgi:LysR family transcriptional regulator, regulator for bpeEF and oprC
MDRIDRLRVFARVVECSSFSKAATVLRLPRSRVSIAVKELEEHLGARLIRRTTRRLALTSEGKTFYERSRRLLDDYEEVEDLFRTSSGHLRGPLRVSFPAHLARWLVAPAIPDFILKYPEIELEIAVCDRLIDLSAEGFDCAVCECPSSHSGQIARSIGELTAISCASRNYIEQHGLPLRLEDLKHHRAIVHSPCLDGKPQPWRFDRKNRVLSVDVKNAIVVDSSEMLVACLLAGAGLAQLPAMDIQNHLLRGDLVQVLPRYRVPAVPLHIVHTNRRHLSGRIQVFQEWILALLRDSSANVIPLRVLP